MLSTIDPCYREAAAHQLYTDLVKRSLPGVIFYLLVWSAAIAPFSPTLISRQQEQLAVIMSSVIALAALIRIASIFLFRAGLRAGKLRNHWLLLCGCAVSSASWGGCMAWLFWFNPVPELLMGLIIATAGLCAGGAGSLAPSRLYSTVFLALVLAPSGLALFFSALPEGKALAGLHLLFFAGMMGISGIQRREYFSAMINHFALQSQASKLAQLSVIDGLTNLKNRAYFNEKLSDDFSRAAREHQTLSLILIDLDHFKKINDTHGHLMGDECLKELARVLKSRFNRSSDTLARFGGEEFAILLPNTDHVAALTLADELRRHIANCSIMTSSEIIRFTASLGLATMSPTIGNHPHELVNHADTALYKAKELGRNRVSCAPVIELSEKSRIDDQGAELTEAS